MVLTKFLIEHLPGLTLVVDEHRCALARVGHIVHELVVVGSTADAHADHVDAVFAPELRVLGDELDIRDARVRTAVTDEHDAVDAIRVVDLLGQLVSGRQAAVEIGASPRLERLDLLDQHAVVGTIDLVAAEHDVVLRVPLDHRDRVTRLERGRDRPAGSSLSICMGWPAIEPEVSSTSVTFIGSRWACVITSLVTASCIS